MERQDTVSISKVEKVAQDVRSDIVEVYGQCYPESKKLMERLQKQTPARSSEIEVEEVFVDRSQTIRHYVVAFPAKYISKTDIHGRILVDITLDQYCTQNKKDGLVDISLGDKEDLPFVAIYMTKEQSPYF